MVVVLSTSSSKEILKPKNTDIADTPKSLKALEEKEFKEEEIVKEITPEKVVYTAANT